MQALPDSPESLCIAEMGGTEGRDGEPGVQGRLYLNIGMFLLNNNPRNYVRLKNNPTSNLLSLTCRFAERRIVKNSIRSGNRRFI